jgi:hypothetical protein
MITAAARYRAQRAGSRVGPPRSPASGSQSGKVGDGGLL